MKLAKKSCETSKDFLIPALDKYTSLIGETDHNKIHTQLQNDLRHWESKIEDHYKKKSTVADKVQAILQEQQLKIASLLYEADGVSYPP